MSPKSSGAKLTWETIVGSWIWNSRLCGLGTELERMLQDKDEIVNTNHARVQSQWAHSHGERV
eukprot:m.165842 g.165842  ORF g.165842 m.165842 type:complete len:63 (+) comp14435_c0_seq6:1070-1258(+)